jgi:DNA-binding NtrC family response regulator
VPKSSERPREGAHITAVHAESTPIQTVPEAQRRLYCVARTPDVALLAHMRSLGWDVVVTKTAAGALSATNYSGVAAGLIDFSDFPPRDFPALKGCLSQPTIGWVAVTTAGVPPTPVVRDLIRSYCFDYVTLPSTYERLADVLGHAIGMAALDHVDVTDDIAATDNNDGMVGRCEAMQRLFRTIRKIAKTDASVFIAGESGTGKELTALAIHKRSTRRKAPFVAINCGSIPHHLLQSELFGYERGAFTGADKRKIGRIESADGGTLFLDEIGDMPAQAQASLLRFLQERKVERLGSTESVPVDVRVISATHVDLEDAISDGRFRSDLYHRLCVLRIDEPPLRARGEDIDILAHYVLQRYKTDSDRKIWGFTQSALDAMHHHEWPGNVRELINRVRRAVVMTEGRLLTPHDMGFDTPDEFEMTTLDKALEHAERSVIDAALRCSGNDVERAAAALGISGDTLRRLMIEYGMGGSGEDAATLAEGPDGADLPPDRQQFG